MSKVLELRSKVKSISRIHKMTEAMQVVAAAQLKTIQLKQRAAWHYKKHYDRMAKRLDLNVQPLVNKVQPVILVYALFSERGFCGGFNENLISMIRRFSREQKAKEKELRLVTIGSKGCELIKETNLSGICKKTPKSMEAGLELASNSALEAYDLFLKGKVEKVYILFNEFVSMLEQTSRFMQFLPFDLSRISTSSDMIVFEPDIETVKENVVLNYIKVLFHDAYMQTHLGEFSSRLISMRGATESSKEMINNLNIKLNKARQAAITFELSEIVSSFEILTEGE